MTSPIREKARVMRATAKTLIVSMTTMAFASFYTPPALADFDQAANDGASFGAEMRNSRPASNTSSSGEMTMYYTDDEGNTQSQTMTAEQLFGSPINGPSDWENLSSAEGDDASINSQSSSRRSSIESDDSSSGKAYRAYDASSNRAHPDFNNDPTIGQSYRVFEQTNSGQVECGDTTEGEAKVEQCHRSNMVRRCKADREVTTQPFRKQIKVFEWHGCYDHSGMSFKVLLDNNNKEVELKGYLIDPANGQRLDMDADKRFVTAPDNYFRYSPDGQNSREAHYFITEYNGNGTERYGATTDVIRNAYPEIDFNYWSKRDNWDDYGSAIYVLIDPISRDDIADEDGDTVVIEGVSFTSHYTRDMSVGDSKITITQQPTEENGWYVAVDFEDNGSGRLPACPYKPMTPGYPDYHGGHGGMAWGRFELHAEVTGHVVSERIIDSPPGCADSIPASCSPQYNCYDREPRDFGEYTEEQIRPILTPLYPGDNPQDASQNICFAMETSMSCDAADYGYDQEQSCRDQQSRSECAFVKSECAAYTEEGDCAYFEDTYDCGYNPNYDSSCQMRQDFVDAYPGCTKTTTTEKSTSSYHLAEPRSCEILHDLSSCQKVRTFTPDGDPTTADPYTDDYYPAAGEEDNDPCVEQPDGFVKEADWVCNTRTAPVEDENGNAMPSPYEPLYPGDDGYCQDATVTYDTTYYYGQKMDCYQDINGETQCPEGNEDNVDKNTCEELEAQSCTLSWTRCVDNSSASNGFCYVEEREYDCGSEVQMEDTTYQSHYDCPGDVKCMGENCFEQTDENNESFGEAMAAMNALQFAGQNADCDENGNCTVFSGEAMECKKALGSYQNCCENPGGPGLAEYLQLLKATGKLTGGAKNYEMVQAAGEAVKGAWNTIAGPVKKTFADVTSKFYTSAPENIAGSADVAGLGQAMTNQAAEFVGEVFGEAARDALFSSVTSEAGEEGGEQVVEYTFGGEGAFLGNAMQGLMTAYMYYTIAVLAIQIIWKCEEEEFELGSKKELRVCHYLGSYCKTKTLGECIEKRESYCCFASPLGRIIQQQARPQLGRSWGSPKYPECGPMTMDEFANLDWSQIDLTEWIAMLTETGLMPPGDEESAKRYYSMEETTGEGNYLARDGQRDNALERSYERQPEDPDQVNRDVEEDVWHQE